VSTSNRARSPGDRFWAGQKALRSQRFFFASQACPNFVRAARINPKDAQAAAVMVSTSRAAACGAANRNRAGGNVSDKEVLKGIKVMVIDDSNTIRRSAEIFLNQAGCEVILAQDGFDALSKITDHEPDVVFVDIMMPRLDGYQTCSLIKRNVKYRGTPVIMLSSKDGLFDRARGRMVGSDQYLTKPFTKDTLLTAVREHASISA
jgi:twitching motility two-component system response regulator PilG